MAQTVVVVGQDDLQMLQETELDFQHADLQCHWSKAISLTEVMFCYFTAFEKLDELFGPHTHDFMHT